MWQTYHGENLQLQQNDAHLWRAELNHTNEIVQQYKSLLSEEECTRATRFIKKSDQEKFILSKGILRHVLSIYLKIQPKMIIFSNTQHKKPFVVGHELQFNVSHSGDYLLIGVTKKNAIGVDIEYVKKNRNHLALAKRFFAQSECRAIKNTPKQDQWAAFYRVWTRKEAFIKAMGLGLSYPLHHFEVSASRDLSNQSALLAIHDAAFSKKDWSLVSVELADLEPNYFAAVTTHGEMQILCFSFT